MQLEIRDLSMTYAKDVHALKDVSLTMPEGLFGLFGPDGAGKSTLMRILAAMQEPSHGRIRLGGIDLLAHADEVRRSIGYVSQEFGVYPTANAEDLLAHFALLRGFVRHWERREIIEALLRRVDLWESRRQGLGAYAPWMRLRFGLAVALLGKPRLLLVDEPTASLEAAERLRLLVLLRELGESRIVVFASRREQDAANLCTRMAILDRGAVVLEADCGQATPLRSALRV